MIDFELDDYKEFKNNKCSLQETSKDTSRQTVQFMTFDNRKVVDFDSVKSSYLNKCGFSEEKAKSVDALFQLNERIYMVEFKNGKYEHLDVQQNFLDSILIFNQITDKQLDFDRDKFVCILVSNDEESFSKQRAMVIADRARMGTGDRGCRGLSHLRDFCCKDVHYWSKKKFNNWLGEMG